MNHGSFFWKKNLHNFTVPNFWKLILYCLKLLKINFSKENSFNQVSEFGNKLFILEDRKRISCKESFS